jgi:Polysaccharide lyase
VLGGSLHDCESATNVERRVAALRLDHWYDFVVHVRWSSKPSLGFVEVWIDGARVLPRIATPTLYEGQGAYLKQGFYRAPSPLTTTVYHAGTRVSDRRLGPPRPRLGLE